MRQNPSSLARSALCRAVLYGAALCAAVQMLAPAAWAADKVVAGSLGGQAPLWAFYIAVQKGFFAADGIDLELNFAQSGAAVTQQLTGGSLDVALSVGITDPIHAIDKGAPLALIRIIGNVPPYVLMGKPGLKSITDLKGKTVSLGQVNDITTVYFERMAAAHGMKPSDYNMLSAGTAAARLAALKAGLADAALVIPPLNFQAEAAGFVTLGVTADDVRDLPFTAMATRIPWASANLALAKRILAVTDKSIAWLADPSHRAEAIDILVKAGRATPADAAGSYEFIRHIGYFEPTSKLSRAKLRNLIEVERAAGRADAALTVDRLVMPGLSDLVD